MNTRELNITNYESWLIDSMDGTLSAAEQASLDAFLSLHPYLDASTNDLPFFSAADEMIEHPDPESLKMPEERELALLTELENDKTLILVPDEQIVFPNKSSLKKEVAPIIPLWVTRIAIAASILGLLMTAFFMTRGDAGYIPRMQQADLPTFDLQFPEKEWANLAIDGGVNKAEEIQSEQDLPYSPLTPEENLVVEELEELAPNNNAPTPLYSPMEELVETPNLLEIPEQLIEETPEEEISYELPKPELVDEEEALTQQENESPEPSAPPSTSVKYDSVLDLLKRATRDSDILAIQDAQEDAPYMETSLKIGNLGLSFKRKKRN